MKRLVLIAVCVAGCAKLEPVVSRFDGAPVETGSVPYRQAMAECEAKAKVASAHLPYTHGRNGELSYAIDQANTEKTALKGCLTERGFKIDWVEKDA